jgi:UDP-2-acetamido-3-amino-2,3-dideoxy-glucuronate N-acetyltransferase
MGDFYQHPNALIDDGALVGAGTRVWAFAHIAKGSSVGEDCNICDHTFIEGGVKIGNRVTVKCGVYLWEGIEVQDDVFIGPCAVFTNNLYPRSKQYPTGYPKTVLMEGSSIGANATILAGITIGRWSMIGAGSVVTRNVTDHALVIGNPARMKAWVCRCGERLPPEQAGTLQCKCGQVFQVKAEHQSEEMTNRPSIV